MSKVILIGIDGATWNIIDPLVRKGYLPNLKRLKSLGLYGNLKSTYPPSSPPAWNSLFSGVNPGRHKIYDFIKRKKNSYFFEPMFSSDRKAPLIWDYLTKLDKKTIAISIPFTYPPYRIKGILTTGLGTPSKESDFTYPTEFKEYIIRNYPKFDVDFEESIFGTSEKRKEILKKIYEVTEHEFLLAKDLFKNQEWDFFTAVFRSTDVIQHYFLNNQRVIIKFYSQLDEYIGWFIDNLDESTYLFLCSDHGFKRVHTRFHINNWLHKNDFLSLNKPSKKISLNFINADKIEMFLNKLGLKELIWKLKRSKLLELFARYLIKSIRTDYFKLIDWKKTKLYFISNYLYLNQLDREPLGVITPEERSKVIKEFEAKIKKLKYKGKFIIKQVIQTKNTYKDASTYDPDISILLNDGFSVTGEISRLGKIFAKETERYGEHSLEGIVCLYHKKGKVKKRTKSYQIYDITPTILKILGVKTSTNFDGKPII